MIELLITYISIWCPALVAILGVVAVVIAAVAKVKAAIKEFRNTDDIKQLVEENKLLRSENKALTERLDLMLDEITKIHDYYKTKKRG